MAETVDRDQNSRVEEVRDAEVGGVLVGKAFPASVDPVEAAAHRADTLFRALVAVTLPVEVEAFQGVACRDRVGVAFLEVVCSCEEAFPNQASYQEAVVGEVATPEEVGPLEAYHALGKEAAYPVVEA